jgi:hypothetical protein
MTILFLFGYLINWIGLIAVLFIAGKIAANVHQKSDFRNICSTLFSNNFSTPESIKKDVPDYQAHLKYLSCIDECRNAEILITSKIACIA